MTVPEHEAVSKASFLSFLRMQEFPKVALDGDSRMRGNDNSVDVVSFYTVSHAGIPFQYKSGDFCIRTNDSLQVGNDITYSLIVLY
ncbi:MAG: hypothetical protein NT007_03120 [Candidatus Kapabacteria bacterium]|nr:hypothetical protein [Candidatus Kapabacteria bacterium]